VVGELKTVVDRIAARKTTFPVHSLALVVNEHGQPLTYAGLRKRFEKARDAAAVVFDKVGRSKKPRRRADSSSVTCGPKRRLI
jgi:hypothetical protein